MSTDNTYVIGYKYLLGMHMALCYGPINSLKRITVGDRVAWSGDVISSQTLTITDAHDLFGGDTREGGVGSWPVYQDSVGPPVLIGDSGTGDIDVMMGEATQTPNDYLVDKAGVDQPAYRGIASLVFKKFFYSSINPYLKDFSFQISRFFEDWYPAKAQIGQDMNPAHIVYECITNTTWGMGYPYSSIDDASFTAVADTLFTENFGLSLLWGQQSSLEDFLISILTHINGAINSDPATGKFVIKLIRDDYDIGTLPVLDTSNVLDLKSFERKTWGETVNEVTVVYKDSTTEKNTPITVQDVANVRAQGQIINQTTTYVGIRNEVLAAKVASRDLRTASSPLAKLKLVVNRKAYGLLPGDAFKFSWSPLGVDSVVFRIVEMDFGGPNNKDIVLEAVEDVFALPSSSYSEQEPVGWIPPNYAPQEITKAVILEEPYYLTQNRLTLTEISELGANFGFGVAAVSPPSGLSLSYDIYDNNAGYPVGNGNFSQSAEVLSEVLKFSTVIPYKNEVNLGIASLYLLLVGDEFMAVTGINTTTKEITVIRAVLDSMPVLHSIDEPISVFSMVGYDTIERVDSEVVNYKLLSKSSGGIFDQASATIIPLTFDSRYQRPYPPANVKPNAEYDPVNIIGAMVLTWSHRDKTQQLAGFIGWIEPSVGLEDGITYSLNIYGEEDTIVKQETGIILDNYTYATEVDDLNIAVPIFYPWPLIQGEPLPPNPYGVSPRDSSIDLELSETSNLIITNDNMTAEGIATDATYVIGNEPIDIEEGGKFYFEFKFDSTPYAWSSVGLWCVAHGYPNGMIGYGDGGYGLQANGSLRLDKVSLGTVGPTCYNGDVIGVHIDFDAGTYQASVNGTLISETLYACNFNDGPYYPAYSTYLAGDKATMRTSYLDMAHRPVGFKPWDNDIPGLPEVTVLDTDINTANITYSNGNLTASSNILGYHIIKGTIGRHVSGRYYFEFRIDESVPATNTSVGIANAAHVEIGQLGSVAGGYCWRQDSGGYEDGVYAGLSIFSTFTLNDICGVGVNFDTGEITFYKNGVLESTSYADTLDAGEYYPAGCVYDVDDAMTLFSAGEALQYLPDGFVPWDNENGAGVSAPPPQYRANSKLRTAIKTTDGTLDSRQTYDHTFDRAGYGYNYGKYYGGKA